MAALKLLSISRSSAAQSIPLSALRRCCTAVERATSEEAPVFASRKAYRRFKSEIIRQNRRDPELEEKSRLRKLHIPLAEVRKEWLDSWGCGLQHLYTLGQHSRIYQDVFGREFKPLGLLRVEYPEGQHVTWGDMVVAKHAAVQPQVTLPGNLEGGFATLILTNPDGHLQDNTQELLHWMVTNIPLDTGDVSQGATLTPYLPPVPPMGTGVHRYVFSLYTHTQPLPTDSAHVGVACEDWLQKRLFSSCHFLASHPVTPCTFSYFQSQWDKSVCHTYQHVLKFPEPVYGPERILSRRQLRRKEIQLARHSRYTEL